MESGARDDNTFLNESPRDYKVLELVGEGETSKVYRCSHKNQFYAIKFVRKAKLQSSERASAMIECELAIHRALHDNPYICKVRGCFQDRRYIYFTYDFIRGGTLAELLAALRGSRFPPVVPIPLIKMWTCQLISVLRALKAAHCVHRDIKSQNIMLNLGDISVIDFSLGDILDKEPGVSKKLVSSNDQSRQRKRRVSEKGHVGTPSYWPPEISLARSHAGRWSNEHAAYPYAADIWAVGCVVYELMTGRLPFRVSGSVGEGDHHTAMSIQAYVHQPKLEWPEDVSDASGATEDWDALRDVCRRLLEPDPKLRQLFIDNDPLEHRAFASMPAYLPAELDPFTLQRSIVTYCSRRSRLNSTLSSMELTPNVGQPFWGQLITEGASKEDQEFTTTALEPDRTIGHAQEIQYTNGADQISREPRSYGLRIGKPPRHVLDWGFIEADQILFDESEGAASPAKHTTPDTLASRNSRVSRSTDNLDGISPSVRGRSVASGGGCEDTSGLADLSAQVNVLRMMNKIEGFLAILPNKKTPEVKLWGAAEFLINMTRRRNSLEGDAHQMCGYCCHTSSLGQSFVSKKSSKNQQDLSESINGEESPPERLLGYALLCGPPLELYVLLETQESLDRMPRGFECENINRLWYLKVCPQGPASPMAPDKVYVHGDVVDVQLRVGNEVNRQAWIKALDPAAC